jgi:outer membrane protein assembly factor BamA
MSKIGTYYLLNRRIVRALGLINKPDTFLISITDIKKFTVVLSLYMLQFIQPVIAQTNKPVQIPRPDSVTEGNLSKMARFSKKAERLFTYIPVPMYSYSAEAGNTFGLAKFNLFDVYKNDTITKPSRISGVFSASTKGRLNFSLSTELVLKNNKFIILSYINYRKTPEYIFGIGNNVKSSNIEAIEVNRLKYNAFLLYYLKKNIYVGAGLDFANYSKVKHDSNSILKQINAIGLEGGFNLGFSVGAAYDTRNNRYNATTGSYFLFTSTFYSKALGSKYSFTKMSLDLRKYIPIARKLTFALQLSTDYSDNDVPFYELSMLGGDSKMRGYYLGALRDKVLVDGQAEIRLPIWKSFGVATWVGSGRVAPGYHDLSFQDFWISYGIGLRVKVDTKHNTNLRFDYGFGNKNIHAFNIGFAEAF